MHTPDEAPKKAKELGKNLQCLERWLKSHFKVMLPVNVYLVKDIDLDDEDESLLVQGLCEVNQDAKCIDIKVCWGQEPHVAREVLMHEWAHARTMWVTDRDECHHPPEFWIDYGRMYQKFYDEGGDKVYKDLE